MREGESAGLFVKPTSQNIKTLLARNKFTLKKAPSFLLFKNIPVIFMWLQLMKLFMTDPVNYSSVHVFGERSPW